MQADSDKQSFRDEKKSMHWNEFQSFVEGLIRFQREVRGETFDESEELLVKMDDFRIVTGCPNLLEVVYYTANDRG
jgi:hypothetical protein